MVQIIEIGSPAFVEMVSAIREETRITVERQLSDKKEVWLNTEEALAFMKIDSPTTLAKYRDEKNSPIICSKPSKDALYLKSSLHEYLMWKKR